jgi:hypothetical protein
VNPWVGLPLDPPAGAARQQGGGTIVYASWNGATQVAQWRVLAQGGGGHFTPVTTVKKSGFETSIPVTGHYQTFEVQALDPSGRQIGLSQKFGVG